MKEQQHAQKREDLIKKDITSGKQKKKDKEKKMELLANVDISDDPVHNDFKRELLFYRQAQSAVMEALPRLKSMKMPTKRPQDYFAQMAKTDEHMQKVYFSQFQIVNFVSMAIGKVAHGCRLQHCTSISFVNLKAGPNV